MFPVPEAVTIKSKLSPFLRVVFEGVTVKSNLPTAPLKSTGLLDSGNGLTLIVLAPAETTLLSSVIII